MKEFKDLLDVSKTLRKNCPWDKKQTLETFKKYCLEEAEEVIEAVDKKDFESLKEELGDLFWNVLFMANIAEDQGLFDIRDVMKHSTDKMVRRHPHVYGDEKVRDVDDIIAMWNRIKKEEK